MPQVCTSVSIGNNFEVRFLTGPENKTLPKSTSAGEVAVTFPEIPLDRIYEKVHFVSPPPDVHCYGNTEFRCELVCRQRRKRIQQRYELDERLERMEPDQFFRRVLRRFHLGCGWDRLHEFPEH